MDWSNRFTLGGLTVTYSTFQMAWEVVKKRKGMKLPSGGSTHGRKRRHFASGRLQQSKAG